MEGIVPDSRMKEIGHKNSIKTGVNQMKGKRVNKPAESNKYTRNVFLLFLSLGICSCGLSNFQSRLNQIRPETTKDELKRIMDQEGAVRGFVVRDNGVVEEVVELSDASILYEEDIYTFRFVDGLLVQWGPGGSARAKPRFNFKPRASANSTVSTRNFNSNVGQSIQ